MSRKADRQWAQRQEAILIAANGQKDMTAVALIAALFNGSADKVQTEVAATRVRIASALVDKHKAEQAQIAEAMEIVGATPVGSHADAILQATSKPAAQAQARK